MFGDAGNVVQKDQVITVLDVIGINQQVNICGSVGRYRRMTDQTCPCSSACDPKNYEGRLMLFPDEAWHNWYLNMRYHPPGKEHREGCGDCMDNYMELEVLKNDGS